MTGNRVLHRKGNQRHSVIHSSSTHTEMAAQIQSTNPTKGWVERHVRDGQTPSFVVVKSIKNTKVGNMKKSQRNVLFRDMAKKHQMNLLKAWKWSPVGIGKEKTFPGD